MPEKLFIWNKRMLEFMDLCISQKMGGIDDQKGFMALLKITATQTIKQIRAGVQSFQEEHFRIVCKKFGLSMDWFYGFTDQMYRQDSNPKPLDLIKEGVRQLEHKTFKK